MCGQTDKQFGPITDVCRKSCGKCTPNYLKTAFQEPKNDIIKENNNNPPPPVIPAFPQAPAAAVAAANPLENTVTDIDPAIAHKQYLNHEIPDVFATPGNGDACSLQDRSDAKLLSRIHLHSEYDPLHPQYPIVNKIRLFCGIYTIKKTHETNVKATRNTWAKKCDGFIAFSNERDESIPSINIRHEGEEAYDNMWQKSRSIWKLIAKELVDSYDFFLLGGDDMMYLVENFRYYLNSPEITKAREEQNGKTCFHIINAFCIVYKIVCLFLLLIDSLIFYFYFFLVSFLLY
jgi:hypothetical protein